MSMTTGCGQPGHVTGGRDGVGTTRWCETCRRIDAEQRLAEAQMLCREAVAWIEKHHEMPSYSELLLRLRAMGGE